MDREASHTTAQFGVSPTRSFRKDGAENGNLASMDPSPGLIRFSEVVARDDFPLDHAAMLIGAWDYPERDLAAYRDQLDRMASYAQPEVTRATGGIGRARAISDCLFDRLGFYGNVGDYYDPRNSFL